jgi:hypothetical protein
MPSARENPSSASQTTIELDLAKSWQVSQPGFSSTNTSFTANGRNEPVQNVIRRSNGCSVLVTGSGPSSDMVYLWFGIDPVTNDALSGDVYR